MELIDKASNDRKRNDLGAIMIQGGDVWVCGVLLAYVTTLFAGCRVDMNDYLSTVRSGKDSIPEAVQIEKLFGSEAVDHFITRYGISTEPVWNSEVFFGERYTLTMQVPVDVDYDDNNVMPTGEPRFWLREAVRVEKLEDGRARTSFGKASEFAREQWAKVVENDGDFAAAGFEVNTEPVKGFSLYVQGRRRDRSKQHVALLE